MRGPDIAERMERYLLRFAGWIEEQAVLLDALEQALAEPDAVAEGLPKTLAFSGRQLETFRTEHRLLLDEWRAAKDLSPERHESLQERFASHTAAVETLARRQQALLARIESKKQLHHEQLSGLAQGRAMLRGYETGGAHEPGYVDKKS